MSSMTELALAFGLAAIAGYLCLMAYRLVRANGRKRRQRAALYDLGYKPGVAGASQNFYQAQGQQLDGDGEMAVMSGWAQGNNERMMKARR